MFSDARNMFVYLLLRPSPSDLHTHFLVQIPVYLQGCDATQLVDKCAGPSQ